MTISEAQRAAILAAYLQGAHADAQVVARNGLTTRALWKGACIDDKHRVTRRGLVEAGVDMDALHADALGLTARIGAEEAYRLPAPKGFTCAAGCGHGIAVHRVTGCDVRNCDCPAPYGRILPSTEAPAPAEARTGISDRTAAALGDVDRLRTFVVGNVPEGVAVDNALTALDCIEQALRERR